MTTIYENQLSFRSDSSTYDDLRDAELIFEFFKTIVELEENVVRIGFLNRTAREVVQKVWQEPRMPNTCYQGYKKLRIKPYEFPWSPKAREAYKNNEYVGKLHLEHSTPMKLIIHRIKNQIKEKKILSREDMLDYLMLIHEGTSFVIITEEEHVEMHRSDSNVYDDVWDRYWKTLRIKRQDCVSLAETEKMVAR